MKKSAQPVRIGLVGCGQAARSLHLPTLQHIANLKVVAVCDIDRPRLYTLANRFCIESRYVDYRRLIEDAAVDAVAVCVPPDLNPEIAIAVLESGKHMFLEKPLALTLAGCSDILRHAAQSKSKAMVGHNLRWHPLIRRARQVLASGELGEICMARTALTKPIPANQWNHSVSRSRALLVETAVHHFDLWRYLFQAEVAEMSATCEKARDSHAVAVTAKLDTGLLVAGTFCDCTPNTNTVEVYGNRARMQLSCFQWDSLRVSSTEAYPATPRERASNLLASLPRLPHALWQGLPRNGGIFYECYAAEWQHFADVILNDSLTGATLDDGAKAVRVALAAAESIDVGRPILMECAVGLPAI